MAQKIRIGPMDAALIFRADGRAEIFMPRMEDEDEVPAQMMTAHLLWWAFMHDSTMQTLAAAMEAELEQEGGPMPPQ